MFSCILPCVMMPLSVFTYIFQARTNARMAITMKIQYFEKNSEVLIRICVIIGSSPPSSAKVCVSVGMTTTMTTIRTTMATQTTKIGYDSADLIFDWVLYCFS